jgi:hypothetical protein
MDDEVEIDDAVNRWIGFYRYRCSLTVVHNDTPVGIATLYLQPYKNLPTNASLGSSSPQRFVGRWLEANS